MDAPTTIAGLSAAAAMAQVVVMILDRRKPNGQAPVTPAVRIIRRRRRLGPERIARSVPAVAQSGGRA